MEMNQLTDRLVDPDVEFRKGPKDISPGPIRVEVMLQDKDDIEKVIEYLKQLSGLVPIPVPTSKRGRKPKSSVDSESLAFHDELVDAIEGMEDPDDILDLLREHSFVGITLEYLKDLGLPIVFQSDDFDIEYRFMVRLLKKAKNPLNNHYDPSLLVGVYTNLSETHLIILSGEDTIFEKAYKESLTDKIVVPLKYKLKFPHYLSLDERNKFRLEMGKLKDDPESKPTRFYTRWVHDIARLNPKDAVFPHIESIPDPYA